MSDHRPGTEFDLILRHFAPLASGEAGAYALCDDAASLAVKPGHELIVTKDMMAAGVHFFATDPPETLGRKILRANLSDLAAMGATPRAYAMGLALPGDLPPDWLEKFVAGLAEDQAQFGVTLIGGDTIRAADGLTMSLTAFGEIAAGRALRRSGAKPGDAIFASGTIGDAALGLQVAEGRPLAGVAAAERETLLARYRLPEPRTELGRGLVGLASAAIDISDGLVADLGHICTASEVGARIEVERVPLSDAAAAACRAAPELIQRLLSGGDDYELLVCAPAQAEEDVVAAARAADIPLGRIGTVTPGSGVCVIGSDGGEMMLERGGYRHF